MRHSSSSHRDIFRSGEHVRSGTTRWQIESPQHRQRFEQPLFEPLISGQQPWCWVRIVRSIHRHRPDLFPKALHRQAVNPRQQPPVAPSISTFSGEQHRLIQSPGPQSGFGTTVGLTPRSPRGEFAPQHDPPLRAPGRRRLAGSMPSCSPICAQIGPQFHQSATIATGFFSVVQSRALRRGPPAADRRPCRKRRQRCRAPAATQRDT